MKLTKWLLVPVVALCFSLVGCGPNDGTTVIESEQQSEEEIAAADTDYDSQYESEYDDYDDGQ